MAWPDEDEIRRVYGAMQGGGSVPLGPDAERSAVSFACARRLNGLGVDRSDEHGEEARRLVDLAVGGAG